MENYSKQKRIFLFLICYFAYTSIYIGRINISIASVELNAQNILSESQIGILGTVFAIVYALFRLVSGVLGDKLKPGVLIVVGLLFAGVCNTLLTFLPSYSLIVVIWGFNAIGQSMLWGQILRSLAIIYDKQKIKKVTSLLATSVATGNILGIVVNSFLVDHLGVKYAFLVPGILIFVCLVFAVVFLLKLPKERREDGQGAVKSASIKTLLKDKNIGLMCLPTFFHGVVKDNVSFWMTLYFVAKYGVDISTVGIFVAFIPLVGLAGRFVYPILFKLTRENEYYVTLISFALSAVCSLLIVLFDLSMVVATVLLGMIYALLSMVNTSALSIFPLKYESQGAIATVSGLMDLFAYSGYGIGSLVFGYIIENSGYTPMFIIWTVLSALGFALTLPFVMKKRNIEVK